MGAVAVLAVLQGLGLAEVASARSTVELHFRVPAAGRYALLRATVPFTVRRGARFPRHAIKLSADTRKLSTGLIVVGHGYVAGAPDRHVRGRRHGQLVIDAVVLRPVAGTAPASIDAGARARGRREGPLRSGDSPGWEYVLELDGRGANGQPLTPAFLFWRYGFTFVLAGRACPDYAAEP